MRIIHIVGALLVLLGGLWILRGAGIGASRPTELRWITYGLVALVTGRALVVVSRR